MTRARRIPAIPGLAQALKDRAPRKPRPAAAPTRCADCGEYGELTGHMECQYPQDHD